MRFQFIALGFSFFRKLQEQNQAIYENQNDGNLTEKILKASRGSIVSWLYSLAQKIFQPHPRTSSQFFQNDGDLAENKLSVSRGFISLGVHQYHFSKNPEA